MSPDQSSSDNTKPNYLEWQLPEIPTLKHLADWLKLTDSELDWLADPYGMETKRVAGSLRHYRYRWLQKSGGRVRLLEMPKQKLKTIQRKILHELLDNIPVHSACHAFVPRRSIATFLKPHVQQNVVLRIDLRDFFPSISKARIIKLFQTMGYEKRVALLLASFCTNTVPTDIFTELKNRLPFDQLRQHEYLYGDPHLPQGAPTSPALANLIAYRLDCRLHGLAQKMNVSYTRYADDLVFSGDHIFRRSLARFRLFLLAIVIDEGFNIRHRKTDIMPSGSKQIVAGVLLNEHLNIPRIKYDQLRATLHNASVHGPDSQNQNSHPDFRAHLLGRIGYMTMLNPHRAGKLHALFEKIDWDD